MLDVRPGDGHGLGAAAARPSPARPLRARLRLGGADGNARLTSLAGAALAVLLAVEGTTLPFLGALLPVHVFVGVLLIGPVALKLAAAGYRLAGYYAGRQAYVRKGPPAPLMRAFVAPVLVLSTLTLLGSGVGLIAAPTHRGLLGLHEASFVVWGFAFGVHLLVYALRAGRHVLAELRGGAVGGRALRLALLAVALAAGLALAVATFPLAGPLLPLEG